MDEATTIARGGQPVWTADFEHDEHGTLTFSVKTMPRAADWLQVATLQEQYAPGVVEGIGFLLAQSLAGILTFMDRPVLKERRVKDPEDPSHERIEKVLYDPAEDERYEFPIAVWAAFSAWRLKVLSPDTVGAVKNSSGATSGKGTDAPSPDATDSPRLTPASAS